MTGRIVAQASILLTRDVVAAMGHWRDVLGFSIDNSFGDPPSFAILKRGPAFVMLGASTSPVIPRRQERESLFDAYFWVDDARAECETLRARGAIFDYEPCLQPYGVLEFGVLDLDDHLIGFGQVLEQG
ncbi:MAG: hypothetical protein MUC44_15485 [Beijerinckiaceae bacterium]|jgi:catechol 2,3-dioxygenase-like lactoylglutathione lyase family enzyme|nr:hypothetical protein [Beijerinckiaceae bacterium]